MHLPQGHTVALTEIACSEGLIDGGKHGALVFRPCRSKRCVRRTVARQTADDRFRREERELVTDERDIVLLREQPQCIRPPHVGERGVLHNMEHMDLDKGGSAFGEKCGCFQHLFTAFARCIGGRKTVDDMDADGDTGRTQVVVSVAE